MINQQQIYIIGGILVKNKFIFWIVISAIIMFAFPWLTVTFIKGDASMAVCFLLFFTINPIYSIFIGIFAGKSLKKLWSLPIISATLFLLGTWTFFDIGETAFIMYALIYFIIGIIAMFSSIFINKKIIN